MMSKSIIVDQTTATTTTANNRDASFWKLYKSINETYGLDKYFEHYRDLESLCILSANGLDDDDKIKKPHSSIMKYPKVCDCKNPSIQMIPLKYAQYTLFDLVCSFFPNEYITFCKHGIETLRFKHLVDVKGEIIVRKVSLKNQRTRIIPFMSVIEDKDNIDNFKRVFSFFKYEENKPVGVDSFLDGHLLKTKPIYYPFYVWIFGHTPIDNENISNSFSNHSCGYGLNFYLKYLIEKHSEYSILVREFLDDLTSRIVGANFKMRLGDSAFNYAATKEMAIFDKLINLSNGKYFKICPMDIHRFVKCKVVDFLFLYYRSIYYSMDVSRYIKDNNLWATFPIMNINDVDYPYQILACVITSRINNSNNTCDVIWIDPLDENIIPTATAIIPNEKKRSRELSNAGIPERDVKQKFASLSFSLSNNDEENVDSDGELQLAQDIPCIEYTPNGC